MASLLLLLLLFISVCLYCQWLIFYVVVENRSPHFNIFSGKHVWSGKNWHQLGDEKNKGNDERQLNATDLKRFDKSGWPDVDLRKSYFPAEKSNTNWIYKANFSMETCIIAELLIVWLLLYRIALDDLFVRPFELRIEFAGEEIYVNWMPSQVNEFFWLNIKLCLKKKSNFLLFAIITDLNTIGVTKVVIFPLKHCSFQFPHMSNRHSSGSKHRTDIAHLSISGLPTNASLFSVSLSTTAIKCT